HDTAWRLRQYPVRACPTVANGTRWRDSLHSAADVYTAAAIAFRYAIQHDPGRGASNPDRDCLYPTYRRPAIHRRSALDGDLRHADQARPAANAAADAHEYAHDSTGHHADHCADADHYQYAHLYGYAHASGSVHFQRHDAHQYDHT